MNIYFYIFVTLVIGLLSSQMAFAAGNADAGKTKAGVCAGCHGIDGHSSNDLWPNLAGQKRGYLVAQLKAYRGGTRNDPLMKPMVAKLTDEDIEDLAAYYASLK